MRQEDREKIANRFREFVTSKGFNQRDISRMTRITPVSINHKWNGVYDIDNDFMIAMRNIFPDFSADWLIFGDPIQDKSKLSDNEFVTKYIAQLEKENIHLKKMIDFLMENEKRDAAIASVADAKVG